MPWFVNRNTGAFAEVQAGKIRQEVKRPPYMSRQDFLLLLVPGNLVEESVLINTFRVSWI